MAAIHKTVVTLRITGDDLVPDDISKLLGAPPSRAYARGQELVDIHGVVRRTAKCGKWSLQATDRSPGDLDGQIRELLDQLTDDLSIWAGINQEYEIDLFCGLFMGRGK
jgi:hypothetical protein